MSQLVAALSMFIDHWGAYAQPDKEFYRYIGRYAAVFFLLRCGVGLRHTRNHYLYSARLFVTAVAFTVVSYSAGFGLSLNVVYIMAIAAIFLNTKYSYIPLFVVPFFDYGFPAYGLIAASYSRNLYFALLFSLLLNGFQLYSLIAFVFALQIWLYPGSRIGPKYWLYYFYPGHLLLIFVVLSIGGYKCN